MMKTVFFLSAILLFASCQEELEPIEVIKEVEIQPEMVAEDNFNYDTLQGIYSGDFAGSSIRIIVSYASGSNAIGYNIHKGLQRNLTGKVLNSNDTIYMTLAEPGDHEYDGVFTLTFVGEDQNPSAMWVSNSGEIKAKFFSISKLIKRRYDGGKLSESDIPGFFDASSDTLGDYSFSNDGFVSFKYYPESDRENRVEQYQKIKGTWSYKDEKVIIDWEKNKLFQSPEIFKIIKLDDYELYLQKADSSRTIWPMYM